MNPLVIVQLIAVAIPLLTQLIQFVEDLVNNSGIATSGADKKSAVVALFGQMWGQLASSGAGSKIFTIPADTMSSLVSGAIDSIVSTLNLLGIFKKSAPVTPAV